MFPKKTIFLVLYVLLIIVNPIQGVNYTPVIYNHNPSFISDFENPITLNWTVLDDNLRKHEIYQDHTLLDEGLYNFSSVNPINTTVTLTFHLDLGRYNFTLFVIDEDNNTVSSSIEILKGTELADIPELRVSGITIIVPLTILIVFNYNRQRNYKTLF